MLKLVRDQTIILEFVTPRFEGVSVYECHLHLRKGSTLIKLADLFSRFSFLLRSTFPLGSHDDCEWYQVTETTDVALRGEKIETDEIEYYEILQNGHHFAGFYQGDPDRYDQPMTYDLFKKEYTRCVEYWKSREDYKFSYTIRLVHIRKQRYAQKQNTVPL